jgi:predicted Holliday junction resolvase-like endonuclease
MRGVALIGMLIAMVIVMYLTLSRLKTSPKLPDMGGGVEMKAPSNMTQLPAQVKSQLNEVMQRNEAERKAAEEALK